MAVELDGLVVGDEPEAWAEAGNGVGTGLRSPYLTTRVSGRRLHGIPVLAPNRLETVMCQRRHACLGHPVTEVG